MKPARLAPSSSGRGSARRSHVVRSRALTRDSGTGPLGGANSGDVGRFGIPTHRNLAGAVRTAQGIPAFWVLADVEACLEPRKGFRQDLAGLPEWTERIRSACCGCPVHDTQASKAFTKEAPHVRRVAKS